MSLVTIPWKDLQVGDPIGPESFGEVYRGKWNGRAVAIKKLLLKTLSDPVKQNFEAEAKALAGCQSERVVRLFGICNEVGNYALVMEDMEKGPLFELLHDAKIDLPWSLRWRLGVEVGEGLAYLHEKNILHSDLKSHNVLLDGQLHAKLSDIAFSKIKIETSSANTRTNAASTVRWHPPELCKRNAVYTMAADVYSFGMILWEIASRKLPFSEAPSEEIVMNWIKTGEQEKIPEDCPGPYGAVVKRCWSIKTEERPSAANAVLELRKAMPQEETKLKQKSWHYNLDVKSIPLPPKEKYALIPASKMDCNRVLGFYSHHPVPGYEIGSVKVIHNPTFNRSFELHLARLQGKHGDLDFAPKWSTENNATWRAKINEIFEGIAKPHVDSDYPNVKLLPLWHGTKAEILDSIFRIGYANLATTDAGFFGKGLYSAYEAEYSSRVYSRGALILNWVATYSPYPVIDGDMQKLTHTNAAYQNYDAHFVPVVPKDPSIANEVNYFPCKINQQHTYTEVVVFDSSACVPRYLVELQPIMTKQMTPKPFQSEDADESTQ